jgi:hypothetical protein
VVLWGEKAWGKKFALGLEKLAAAISGDDWVFYNGATRSRIGKKATCDEGEPY